MADQANERLKALKASIKVALGKLTGSAELEAQGVRERSRGGGAERERHVRPKAGANAQGKAGVKNLAKAETKARSEPAAKKDAASRGAKGRPERRRS